MAWQILGHLVRGGADGLGAFGEGGQQIGPLLHEPVVILGLHTRGLQPEGLHTEAVEQPAAAFGMPEAAAVGVGFGPAEGDALLDGTFVGEAVGIAQAGFAQQPTAADGGKAITATQVGEGHPGRGGLHDAGTRLLAC
jgi:hypothetical protein